VILICIELEQVATTQLLNKRASQQIDLAKLEKEFTAKKIDNGDNNRDKSFFVVEEKEKEKEKEKEEKERKDIDSPVSSPIKKAGQL
jgi:hypothetical protein